MCDYLRIGFSGFRVGARINYEIAPHFVADLRADLEALRDANMLNQGENQECIENTRLISEMLEAAARDMQQLYAILLNR